MKDVYAVLRQKEDFCSSSTARSSSSAKALMRGSSSSFAGSQGSANRGDFGSKSIESQPYRHVTCRQHLELESEN